MQEQHFCKTCTHFIQHYRKAKKNYYELYCGHCIQARVKRKTADTKACAHYIERQTDTKKSAS